MIISKNVGLLFSEIDDLLDTAFAELSADEYIELCESIIECIRAKIKEKNNMLAVEINKEFADGHKEVERKEFRNKYEMYKYVIIDSLETNMESAREELEDNEFIALCLQICGSMAAYFN